MIGEVEVDDQGRECSCIRAPRYRCHQKVRGGYGANARKDWLLGSENGESVASLSVQVVPFEVNCTTPTPDTKPSSATYSAPPSPLFVDVFRLPKYTQFELKPERTFEVHPVPITPVALSKNAAVTVPCLLLAMYSIDSSGLRLMVSASPTPNEYGTVVVSLPEEISETSTVAFSEMSPNSA